MGAGLGCAAPHPFWSQNWGWWRQFRRLITAPHYPLRLPYLGAWVRPWQEPRRRGRPLAALASFQAQGRGPPPCEGKLSRPLRLHLPAREADLER